MDNQGRMSQAEYHSALDNRDAREKALRERISELEAALSAERARVIEQAEQIATDAAINEEIILRDFMGRPDLAGAWQDACNYIAAALRALGQQDTE